ncbi:MAG: hypothetical protein NTW16_09920 [Bacteroidetes bacterium]|nr:hypothetical protein [Bacteroidota bacterium]
MQRKLFFLLISILAFNLQSIAQGDLLITPTRVVFEGYKQKEELNLVNTGNDTAIYSISFLQYNMKEDGNFTQIETPDSGQMFAEPYLRIFPRRVTLAPREPQVISLQFRRKPEMQSGEYRSHLYFRAEKDNKPLGLDKATVDTTQLKVQLIPIFGLSIPIIIRTGTITVAASLNNLKIENRQDTIPYLNLTINRTGNISVYGDISVEYIPVEGKSYEIGTLKGVGVYTNINKRNVSIKLNKTPGTTLKNGKLKVLYTGFNETKRFKYSEEEMEVK